MMKKRWVHVVVIMLVLAGVAPAISAGEPPGVGSTLPAMQANQTGGCRGY